MPNLYTPSKLISHEEFLKLEKAFDKMWSLETVNPDVKDNWSEKNKALGQCIPTALVVNDLYGGRMIYDKSNYHVWNELPDGSQQDFSRIQFLGYRTFKIYNYKTKDELLYDETGQRTGLLKRYQLLKHRLQEAISS